MNKRALIPNAITTANCVCGFYAITLLFQGNYRLAAILIIVAGFFDLFDGRIARLVKGGSEFGEHFDTLSDFLSFGIAPGMLVYRFGFETFGEGSRIAGFLYAFAVAVRLARFGVKNRPVTKGFFEGLSSPPSAATLAGFALFVGYLGLAPTDQAKAFVAMAMGLAFLMVSAIRFPSFKATRWTSAPGALILAIGVIFVALSIYKPEVYFFLFGATYIVSVLVWNLMRLMKPRQNLQEQRG